MTFNKPLSIVRLMTVPVAAALLALAAGALGLRLYLERPAENRLRPGEDVAPAALAGPLPANAWLACPPGRCRAAGAAAGPVFAVAADRLYRALRAVIAAQPRTVIVREDPGRRRLVAIQRSPGLGFPDIVIAESFDLGSGRAGPALYSRARYGRWDFGVNRRRVETWLTEVRRALGG